MAARCTARILLGVVAAASLPAAALDAQAAERTAAWQRRRGRSQAAAKPGAADRRRLNCHSTGLSCRAAFTSRSMPAASPMRARSRRQARHRVRRQHRGQGVGDRRCRRQAPGQGDRLRPRPAEPASPSMTARSTSPRPRASPRSTMSRTPRQSAASRRAIYADLPQRAERHALHRSRPRRQALCLDRQPCNDCMPPPGEGAIRRIDLDRRQRSRRSRAGVRNSQGFDWSPRNKTLYFTDNGRDWLSEDAPADELNRVEQAGREFRRALLLCRATWPTRESAGATPATIFAGPIALLGPHVAPLGFALLHWPHVSTPLSRRHLRRPPRLLEQDQKDRRRCHARCISTRKARCSRWSRSLPVFFRTTTFSAGRSTCNRCTTARCLISDDWNGAVYRITYGSGREQREERHRPRSATTIAGAISSSTTIEARDVHAGKKPSPARGPARICRRGGPATFPEGNLLLTGSLWEDTHPVKQRGLALCASRGRAATPHAAWQPCQNCAARAAI